jgi:Ca2+-binding EF-hand superfamily protein
VETGEILEYARTGWNSNDVFGTALMKWRPLKSIEHFYDRVDRTFVSKELDHFSAVFHLERLGYSKEASYFKSLLHAPPTPSVPAFSFCASTSNLALVKIFIDRVIGKRISLFRSTIITSDDMQLLQKTFSGSPRLRPFVDIPWSSLIETVGKIKGSLLFSESILRPFITPNGHFRCKRYFNFLGLLSDIQFGLSTILKIEPRLTDTIDMQTFEQFVETQTQYIECLARLRGDLAGFKEFYIAIVVAHFTFMLCPSASTNFSLVDLMISRPFIEFVHLDSFDAKSSFSIHSTFSIYTTYVSMDVDGAGLLSSANLEHFHYGEHTFHFSSAFRDRFFDLVQTFSERIDFHLFLKLFFCIKHMDSVPAAEFFVNIFDLDGDGVVGRSDIEFFYRSIVTESRSHETFSTYFAELLDQCQAPPTGFGVRELRESGDQPQVIRMLIDLSLFEEESGTPEDGR